MNNFLYLFGGVILGSSIMLCIFQAWMRTLGFVYSVRSKSKKHIIPLDIEKSIYFLLGLIIGCTVSFVILALQEMYG